MSKLNNMYTFEIYIDDVLIDISDHPYGSFGKCIRIATLDAIKDSIIKDESVTVFIFENLNPMFSYKISDIDYL